MRLEHELCIKKLKKKIIVFVYLKREFADFFTSDIIQKDVKRKKNYLPFQKMPSFSIPKEFLSGLRLNEIPSL